MSSYGKRFAAIYDSLPQDAQQSLVYKQLLPLLNVVPKPRGKKALCAAERMQKRHASLRKLDLRAKKLEIEAMLRELSKDAKRSYVMDASNQFELLHEIVRSLASWLNDIWSAVYEHHVDFALAHECLLFVSASLDRLDNVRIGCKYSLNEMYNPVILRNKRGRIVKKFDISGAMHLENVSLFIWRDLMLSLLAHGTPRQMNMIPQMLADIEGVMGWKALVRMLFSRNKDAKTHKEPDDESDWQDTDEEFDEDGSLPDLDAQSESSAATETEDGLSFTMPRLRHWSDAIYDHAPLLERRVETALTVVFEASPSLTLYSTILSISRDSSQLEERLLASLREIATVSSDVFAVALEIYSLEHQIDTIVELLDSHSHLLRPRDFHALQSATTQISHHGHGQRALQILETELLDVVHIIRRGMLQSFSLMEEPANRAELLNIIKLPRSTPGRRGRLESWVDAVTTPGADAPNPMVIAALFMGVQGVPGMNNDDDQYTYLDIDQRDPDLEDLRAEFRPNLKKRFESWADTALTLKGGPATLLTVYKKIVDILPFLRATDVTEEMMASRLQDRISKQWIYDGLDALLAFVKVYRRKWNTMKVEIQKKKEAAKAAEAVKVAHSSSSNTTPFASSAAGLSASSSNTAPPPRSRSESPGPPPLEPVGPAPSSSTAIPLPSRSDSPGPPPLEPIGPAPPPQPAPQPAPAQGPVALDINGQIPAPLVAHIDAILAALPAPAQGPNHLTLMNLLMMGGPPPGTPPPAPPQGPPEGYEPRSAIDDVD